MAQIGSTSSSGLRWVTSCMLRTSITDSRVEVETAFCRDPPARPDLFRHLAVLHRARLVSVSVDLVDLLVCWCSFTCSSIPGGLKSLRPASLVLSGAATWDGWRALPGVRHLCLRYAFALWPFSVSLSAGVKST